MLYDLHMSELEIGREIERLHQRILALEAQRSSEHALDERYAAAGHEHHSPAPSAAEDLSGFIEGVGEAGAGSTDIVEDLGEVLEDFTDALMDLANAAPETAGDIGEGSEEVLEQVVDLIEDATDAVQETVRDVVGKDQAPERVHLFNRKLW
jgi:ElaB/YqjD/DUF883 family membrane-anchored ribosome-binding protein